MSSLISRRAALCGLALILVFAAMVPAPQAQAQVGQSVQNQIFFGVLGWPEEQRAFFQDGPGWLLSRGQREELLDLDSTSRQEFIDRFLADPIPETPENEMVEGIKRRRALVLGEELQSFQDARSRLLFLHGPPTERFLVDCAETFRPLELWFYSGRPVPAVVYRERADQPYRAWLPLDGKAVLYVEEMNYYLEQWEELKHRITGGKRIDKIFCEDSERVDEILGIDGLYDFEEDRPGDSAFLVYQKPPADRVAWARAAATTEVEEVEFIEGGQMQVFFPEKNGQRMLTHFEVVIEDTSQFGLFEERESKQLRLLAEAVLERPGTYFEQFRVRYQIPVPEAGFSSPIALTSERLLRPGGVFLLRMKLIDEISGRIMHLSRGLEISRRVVSLPAEAEIPEDAIFEIAEDLAETTIPGFDSLILVPPVSDVIFGLWRAEALVTGERISRVKYFVDGKQVFSRKGPPFTAELRLADFPKEQTVRAEGYDAQKELVASDEIVINQPRGELRVRIIEPTRGTSGTGAMKVRAEVVVPEEKAVDKVEVKVNEQTQKVLTNPPWETEVEIPSAYAELTYLTVTATLDDGLSAEDVRFINAPDYIEEVDVNLVELYTTVTERGGGLARGLTAEDFRVLEDGREQEISKFELVENLPLSLGIVIDTSGSMVESLGEAQRAAITFLQRIITSRDRCFAVAFSDRPEILMPRTSDVGAIEVRLEDLVADGATSLHDAVVTSLYYYRGIRGRRAMILLSDGEDTASSLAFREALEFAKRSGVAIYSIGLRIDSIDFGIRKKLDNLASETGGRTFFIDNADELADVYEEIERELRSQYLIAYGSNSTKPKDQYREIDLKIGGGRKARTIRGYYP